MLLKDQVALITASASGIGQAIAQKFAEEGARVVITSRNIERGAEVEKQIRRTGGECVFIQADPTKEEDVQRLVNKAKEVYGRIDILVNNVGGVKEGTVITHTLEEWNAIFTANVTTCYLLSHYTLPLMVEKGDGVVLNISSEVAQKGYPKRAAYSAAKAAIIGLTRAMAVDHAEQGIRVNVICPGTVETPMITQLIEKSGEKKRTEFIRRRLLPYLGSPDDIANTAAFICSREARYFTGSVVSVDGGSTCKG